MSQTIREKNKALVLEAFDTLFNRRDYAAAEQFWSPNYIQHSAHIAPGREGLFNLIKSIPQTLRYEPGVMWLDVNLRARHDFGPGLARVGPPHRMQSSVVRCLDAECEGS
jgi:hypothetical protein